MLWPRPPCRSCSLRRRRRKCSWRRCAPSSLHAQPDVAELLLAAWTGYSPAVRREVVEALFARADRLPQLLTAIEQKKVLSNQLEPLRVEQLRKHPNAKIRERAGALLAGQAAPDRQKMVEDYRAALDLKADAARGKAVFKKNCTLSSAGERGRRGRPRPAVRPAQQVGRAAAQRHPRPEPRSGSALSELPVVTTKGQTFTGLIAAETASSVTLRRGEKAEDTILRSQIEEIQATGKSAHAGGTGDAVEQAGPGRPDRVPASGGVLWKN